MREVELSTDNYHDNYPEIIETMAERDDNDRQPATCFKLICRDYMTLSTVFLHSWALFVAAIQSTTQSKWPLLFVSKRTIEAHDLR